MSLNHNQNTYLCCFWIVVIFIGIFYFWRSLGLDTWEKRIGMFTCILCMVLVFLQGSILVRQVMNPPESMWSLVPRFMLPVLVQVIVSEWLTRKGE